MKLTKLEDRPVALLGIATLVQRFFGEYLTGMWRVFLPFELLWSAGPSCRPKTYRAPSWSWLSAEGRIYYCHCDFDRSKDEIWATVIDAYVSYYDGSSAGQISGGELRIRGRLGLGTWDAVHDRRLKSQNVRLPSVKDPQKRHTFRFRPTTVPQPSSTLTGD